MLPKFASCFATPGIICTEPGGDVDPRLAVLVALVDVDVGHVEELLQPRLVILLYRAEDGGQHEVVILE